MVSRWVRRVEDHYKANYVGLFDLPNGKSNKEVLESLNHDQMCHSWRSVKGK